MRRAGAISFVLASAVVRSAAADCAPPAGCVDAEPQWLSPSAARFLTISDPASGAAGKLSASAIVGFRYRPAVLTVPAPSRDGRDINLLRHSTDVTLSARMGLGKGVEVTLLLPAGLYQRGSGIKGVTEQSAPAIPLASLHDPRVGFGVELTRTPAFAVKLRFEAKLPLGSREALGGEASAVASPSVALSAREGGLFAGAELGLRLRTPATLFGTRVGSQAVVSAGVGYELAGPRLALAIEAYLLPSLVAAGPQRHLPGEWLGSLSWATTARRVLTLGASGGSGLSIGHDGSFALGVPQFRTYGFLRFTP